MILFTENTKKDKKIASDHFIYWYIKKGRCFDKKDMIKDTIRISNLYLNNKYISKSVKNKISSNLKGLNPLKE